MKRFSLKVGIATSLCILLCSSAVHAEDVGENFNTNDADIYIHYTDFPTNQYPANSMETELSYAGTTWKTFAFTRKNNYFLQTGFLEVASKIYPTISTTSPVDANYFKGLVHVEFETNTNPDSYAHSMKMFVSTSADFTSSDTEECEMECMTGPGGEYYFFDIPLRQSQDYYKFEIDIPQIGPKDGWFMISEIFLYKEGNRVQITLDDTEKVCNIVAHKGDLHVKAVEYDVSGAVVDEDVTRAVSKASEELWTNKVANAEETYTIAYPGVSGNYIEIRAKSVGTSGIHSPEKSVTINNKGIVTSINCPINDESETAAKEWYDISGRRLNGPATGINILRQGSKTTRVIKK